MNDETRSLLAAFRNAPVFENYDPHADLLDLAIWSMYHWVKQDSDRRIAEQAAAESAAAPSASNDSNDSNVSSRTDIATHRTPASNDSNDSTRTDTRTHRTPVSNDSNVSTRTDTPTPRLTRAERAALLEKLAEPATQEYLNALQYFFSASDILALMQPEALRRGRADLVERLTPASVGRLLSELDLQRDRTSRGRRFRLTYRNFVRLLETYIYVFNPEGAKTAFTRRWNE